MLIVESSQLPAADDISFESLEYLFGPAKETVKSSIPWVEIADQNQEQVRQLHELQGKTMLLEQQLQNSQTQLQRVCILIGYMQGLLNEKEEALKALPDLRFRAAESVGLRLELGRSKEKIQELEADLQRQERLYDSNLGKMLRALFTPLDCNDKTSNLLMWLGLAGLLAVFYSLLR